MEVVIDIIGTETIKPSSSTPDHLQDYRLSFTDQTSSTLVIPIILCYPPHTQYTNSYQLNHLKKSLSNALAIFYPLAGRIVDNSHINCNDSGVSLVETRVHCELSQVIKNSNVGDFVNKFLPSGWDVPSELPLVIQANLFKCGGMAVGLGFSHKVGDVPSFMMLIHCLAAIARGDDSDHLPSPKFDSSTLFPPKDVPSKSEGHGKKLDIVTKRFVLSSSSIASLKHKYADDENPTLATKVEAASAFAWRRLMASTQENAEADKMYLLANAMDLRPVSDPPIPHFIFGNMGWISMTTATSKDLEEEGYGLVRKMREAERDVNAGIVAKLGESDFDAFKETFEKYSNPRTVACVTSSFCGLGLYEADLGWGKPIWIASATFPVKNAVILMDTKSGGEDGGIEVWVNLTKEDMAKFEVDKEFLSLVSSPDSS